MFDAVPLVVKEPTGEYREEHIWHTKADGQSSSTLQSSDVCVYSDGSVESDLPMQQLSELFNINHFIVSQVNPHSPFMSTLQSRATAWSSLMYTTVSSLFVFLQRSLKSTLKNIVDLRIYRAVSPTWGTRRMLGVFQTVTQVSRVVL
jgi:predicted acylesterase/phospholipase RssA